MKLGVGSHYGEWWGQGIQRNYGIDEKRFWLFNTARWSDERPSCCGVVPILYRGMMSQNIVESYLFELRLNGSYAVEGFMKPEGVVIHHSAAGQYFKITLENDGCHKGEIK